MAHEYSGLFITFEGGEGSGKSTQVRAIADYLATQGRDVVVTKAPGGIPLGVRELVLNTPEGFEIAPRAEALLFLADIAQLTESVILPALRTGSVVLCDRFIDSTIAYQGAARSLGFQDLTALSLWATGMLLPDITVLLDVPVQTGLSRKSGDEWNRMEQQGIDFHKRVHDEFADLAASDQRRFVTVNADQPLELVTNDTIQAIRERMAVVDLRQRIAKDKEASKVQIGFTA